MDPEEAIETQIEPKLIPAFGSTITRSLLTMATLAYVTAVGGKTHRYCALVDSICSNERVVQQWGEAVAARQASEWKTLVPTEPESVVVLTHRASSEESPR
jgi:hypothetical protein